MDLYCSMKFIGNNLQTSVFMLNLRSEVFEN